ncbi:MAG: methyltransferase, partial [Parasporobacterium sp.]|nr:methyltransferase [Parasporobacterium sp.]
MDAVLLSGFVSAKPQDRIIDLGTGTGIIPLLLNAKTGSKDITGIEIQEESAEMAQRSVRLNDLE